MATSWWNLTTNAIFVNTNIVTNVRVLDVFEAYNFGYKNYENRKNLFHYNHDVEILQELGEQKALDFINNLFSEYKTFMNLGYSIMTDKFWTDDFDVDTMTKYWKKV